MRLKEFENEERERLVIDQSKDAIAERIADLVLMEINQATVRLTLPRRLIKFQSCVHALPTGEVVRFRNR